jgi:tetratricopeptide (TPR) repeat protein
MNLGCPYSALPEFQSAVVNFRLGYLHEELANTYDNMGHVHARLGNHALAADLIKKGLSIRRALGDDYRTGLSLNSGAVAHLGSARLSDARESAEEALGIMRRLNSSRGIGLTSITLGRVMCSLGDCLAVHSEPGERHRCLEESESHLQRAVVIFERDVDEPLRLVHASLELAHLYEVMSNSGYCSTQIRRQVAELQLKARLVARKRGFRFSQTR